MFPSPEPHLHSEEYRCVRHGFPTLAKKNHRPTRAERAAQTPIAAFPPGAGTDLKGYLVRRVKDCFQPKTEKSLEVLLWVYCKTSCVAAFLLWVNGPSGLLLAFHLL